MLMEFDHSEIYSPVDLKVGSVGYLLQAQRISCHGGPNAMESSKDCDKIPKYH